MVTNTNLLEVRRRILLNTPHLESMSGNPAIFTTDMAANLKECKIRFSPVQAGEGTPSPENVRPISGWDGVSVTQVENLFICNERADNGITFETIDSNGTIRMYGKKTTNSFGLSFSVFFSFPTSRTVTIKGCPEYTGNGRGFFIWDETSRNSLGYVKNGTDFTKTLAANHEYVLAIEITIYQSVDMTFAPIIIDNTNTTAISIPFPQTIYGGYVDLIKGEIVEEIDSEGQEITPNVYPLTPQTIKALRGLNNLYSDANGNVEVKFWSHEQYQTLSGEYEITDDNYLLTTNDGYVIDF